MSFSARSGSHFGWSGAFCVALSAFGLGGFGLSVGAAGLSGGGGCGSWAKLRVGEVSSAIPIHASRSASCKLLPIPSFGCSLSLRMLQTPFIDHRCELLMGQEIRATDHLSPEVLYNSSMM